MRCEQDAVRDISFQQIMEQELEQLATSCTDKVQDVGHIHGVGLVNE